MLDAEELPPDVELPALPVPLVEPLPLVSRLPPEPDPKDELLKSASDAFAEPLLAPVAY